VIHVDLDGARHVYAAHGWSWTAGDDPLFDTGLAGLLDLLEALRLRATLFVIAEDLDHAERCERLREALRRGHSVASHSLTHRHLTSLDRAERQREIEGSRRKIEERLGVTPAGFRAPGFAIDHDALQRIDAAGYRYDSSLFCGAGPHRPLDGRGLLELPLPPHAPLPLPFHPSYALVLGAWYFALGLARFRRSGRPLVLLLHLTDTAAPLPRATLRGPGSRLFTLSHRRAETKRRLLTRMLNRVGSAYRFTETSALIEAAT